VNPGLLLSLVLGGTPTARAAETSPLCAALLPARADVAGARAAIAAGADVSARCSHEVTIQVRRRLGLAEVLLGVIVPPVGVLMMLDDRSHPATVTRSPAPLDLAISRELPSLADALLDAGADPLQPAPGDQALPLVTAIAQDMRLGGATWTTRLLGHCDHVPADLLRAEERVLDALLDAPELLAPLLALGLDTEGRDRWGRTWLTRAARDGAPRRAHAALASGADPNLRLEGETPLGAAVGAGDLAMMALLLEAGAAPSRAAGSGRSLAARAVEQSDPAVLDAVLAMGARADGGDGEGRVPIMVAASRGALAATRTLLAHGALPTDEAVLEATRRGNAELLRILLDAGGDPDAEGPFSKRPLHHALKADQDDLVALLLAAGADPGRRSSSFVFDEPPPVRIPLAAGDERRVRALLPYVNAAEREWLVVFALADGNEAMAASVVDSGVDLGTVLTRLNAAGDAPARAWLRARGAKVPVGALVDVLEFGDIGAVQEALGDGADPNHPGGMPARLPAVVALERGDAAVLGLLRDAGARLPPAWSARKLVRDTDPAVLELAIQLGATAGESAISEASFWNEPAALEVLARNIQDPEPWRRARSGIGPLAARIDEIHAEKKAAATEARRAARRARRAARRARD
jgi:ankyrin repeat protein